MKKTSSLALALAGLFAVSAHAQFTGSDDFNTGSEAKWAYAFRTLGSGTSNGSIDFTNSRLDFTKGTGAGSQFVGWDGDGAGSNSRTTASFTTSWVADLTVTNTFATGSEFANIGFEIGGSSLQYAALMLGSVNGTSVLRTESSGTTGVNVAALDNTDVVLRLAWNADTQVLNTFYSYDLGANFTLHTSYSPLSTWSANAANNGFYFEVFGTSDAAGAITVGSMFADNFSISAIPEPSTYAAMAGAAALGLAFWRRRHSRVASAN